MTVDRNDFVLDVLVQSGRNTGAAKRLMSKLQRHHVTTPALINSAGAVARSGHRSVAAWRASQFDVVAYSRNVMALDRENTFELSMRIMGETQCPARFLPFSCTN
jgi:transposase-like protein